MNALHNASRRKFLKDSAVLAGGLVIGFYLPVKGGRALASVAVTLRVLPFVLPAPKAYCDPQRDFLVASYTYINIDMIKEEK